LRLPLRTYNRSPPINRVALTRALGSVEESVEDETFPDIGSMSDEELKELIDNLTAEEQKVSYRRRSEILAGRSEPTTKPPT
jgi:hypothetical protein